MDSRPDSHLLLLMMFTVAISSAAFYLSLGLEPWWWPIWLAALPILWITPRISWPVAAAVAMAARLIGGLSMWGYHQRLQFPLWLRLEVLLAPSLAFCAGVLLFRGFLRRGKPWFAILAFPAAMVTYEYLISLVFGTFEITGYTQLKNLPVLQLGSLTGLWGISFAVMLFPSMIAAILLSQRKMRLQLMIAFAIIFGGVLMYGGWRLLTTPRAPHTIAVGLVASDLPKNFFPQNDAEAMRLMRDYAEQVKLLSQRGAKIVVLPEMTALVRDSISGQMDELFQETARAASVQVVVGVLHVTPNNAFNEARLYSDMGALKAVYRKHHLVPVIEGRTSPGDDISVVPQAVGTIGLEICRDMDYSDPARRYGKAKAGLVLVPAWDFDVDRLWHGHMAIMRAVEDGFTLVRVAKAGLLTVSDDRGHVLAEAVTTPKEPFTTLLTTAPVRHDVTLYQSWGDWFAWINLVIFACLFAVFVAKQSTKISQPVASCSSAAQEVRSFTNAAHSRRA